MLLTRTPLYSGLLPFAFDLHVLGTPPALILSQDQTLKLNLPPLARPLQDSLETNCLTQDSLLNWLFSDLSPVLTHETCASYADRVVKFGQFVRLRDLAAAST